MSRPVRVALILMAIVLMSAPLSIVVTLLSFPLWSWFEASTGIESVGHSGPAEWCYAVTFVALVAAGAVVSFGRRRGTKTGADSAFPRK